MTLPLDNDIFVNVLRETCLSATLQLANSLSTTSQSDSGFTNLKSPSLFGRIYRENDVSNKLDIYSNFPLLSKLPRGSPPIKFENSISDNMLRLNKYNNTLDHFSNDKSNSLKEESNINNHNEEDYDDEDEDDEDASEDESEDEFENESIQKLASNSIKQRTNSTNQRLKYHRSNDSISFNDTSSIISKLQRNRKSSIASTLSSNITPIRQRRRPLPPLNHRRTSSTISTITITETEDEHAEDEHAEGNNKKEEDKNLHKNGDTNSVNSQITDLTSSQSSHSEQTKFQNLTPIKRPELGDRSVSLNTLKSNKFDFESPLNTPISNKSSIINSTNNLKTPISALSLSKSQYPSSGLKKSNKGLRSLGRFIRSKQIASTFTHHSASNSNVESLDLNQEGGSDYDSQDYSDSALILKKEKDIVNNKNDNKNTDFTSQSEYNLNDPKISDKLRNLTDLPLVGVKSNISSNGNSVNSETKSLDIAAASKKLDIHKSNDITNDNENESKENEQNDDNNNNNIHDNDDNDDNDDNYDDNNSERDTIDSSDFDDNDSVVDSIESSELADSDYDYFNPPATADASRIERRSLRDNRVRHTGNDNILDNIEGIDSDVGAINSLGASSTSGIRNKSRDLYHSYDGPDVDEYVDDLDSEDYISDAEDYTIDDSVGYYEGDSTSSNPSDLLSKGTISSSILDKKRFSSSSTSTSSKLELLPKVNSISKINFVHSRPGMRSTSGSGASINASNIGLAKSLAQTKRRKSLGGIRSNTLIMTDTGNSLLSSDTVSTENTLKLKKNKPIKSAKSYNNLINFNYNLENEEKRSQRQKLKNSNALTFDKIDIKKKILSSSKQDSSISKASKLTELIHKKAISLDYYKYVTEKQNIGDKFINLKICCPDLKITYKNSIKISINSSVKVVELIGYILFELHEAKNENLDKHHLDPNYWKLYLTDDDGEIEDDFGVIDRTRSVESYGADEFVLVECTDLEMKKNEKLTPSPLEKGSSSVNDVTNNSNIPASTIMKLSDLTFDSTNNVQNESVATLPGELTPTSGLTFTNTLPNNNYSQQQLPSRKQKLQQTQFVLDDLDSDDDNLVATTSKDKRQVKRDIKKYLKPTLNTSSTKVGFYEKDKEKESKLNKFKTRSKTIQSILHNTADHYQQTQQELFRAGNDNNKNNNMTFGSIMGNMNGVNTYMMNNNGIVGNNGIGNGSLIDGGNIANTSIMSYNKNINNNNINNNINNNNYLRSDIFGNEGTEGDNKANMYHRWTVWRKQQMKFKSKLPKTLTVDGYQIYLLPFNEFKGSWYESKTYNFDISQILKIKQNSKIPNDFKIVINKNTDGMVKKYQLEARNAKECREIVDTIRALAKTYSEQM